MAPKHLVNSAWQLGKNQRLKYDVSTKHVNDEEERLTLYAEYFSQCSIIGAELDTGDSNSDQQSLNSPASKLGTAIGVDSVAYKFLTLPNAKLTETLQSACLKNELQFQCAYGFLDDLASIRENIEMIKQTDGTFKVMAERECRHVPKMNPANSLYECIHKNAGAIYGMCRNSIEDYNSTRHDVNERVAQIFDVTVATIEDHAGSAIAKGDNQDLEQVLRKGESLIENTLNTLAIMESFKCQYFIPMEKCVHRAVQSMCGDEAADSLVKILRIGYLQRERGDSMHQQFLEAQVQPHGACLMFS
ncbi:hypothetical protein Ddc_00552 [Ditylenchus destructor]|nr:hypothetical protein Ddc_00552 [Ditylenchus destructor]